MSRPYRTMLLGVSASIGILNVHQYLQVFQAEVADEIRVIMTPRAAQMLRPDLLGAISGHPVLVEMFDGTAEFSAPHVNLPEWAQVFAVLPATADLIGRAANGLADDLLTTAILASPRAVVFFPNMNPLMWKNPAVQRNVELLCRNGHRVVEPTGSAYQLSTGQLVTGASIPPPRQAAAILRELTDTSAAAATAS